MQAIYSPAQMREVDRCLIAQYGIPGIELMERAARGVFDAVVRHAGQCETKHIVILCGRGNNGGDGLAVLRMLHQAGFPAKGILLCGEDALQGDAAANLVRARQAGCRFSAWEETFAASVENVIVDALYGTGLSRDITGHDAALVNAVNAGRAYTVAVDIPSGIDGNTGEVRGCAVEADETVTFQNYKPGLLLFPGRSHAGHVTLHAIAEERPPVESALFLLEKNDIAALLPPRPMDSHKGRNGRVLLLAGSEAYAGAALLCSAAALRGGCGLFTAAVPAGVKPIFSSLPEAMCLPMGAGGVWDGKSCRQAVNLIGGQQAIAFGCGMGTVADPALLKAVLQSGIPSVVDADGLNLLARERDLLNELHKNVILTPHPGEMARLLHCPVEEILRAPIETARRAAQRWRCIVLLKGATTCISDGERVLLNTSGNPGLAKGGSGDTLTGLIAAMLSQGLTPMNAACAGAYLLGASADLAYQILGTRMLLAGDVTAAVEQTLGRLSQVDAGDAVADA